MPDASTMTEILADWKAGEPRAFERLMEALYDELHAVARQCFRKERAEHTLQPTALVNEAVLRLIDLDDVDWRDRGHFFATTARMMRRILVDHARRHDREKRGGGVFRVPLDGSLELGAPERRTEVEALDAALEALERRDPRKARIVELRFFVGLTAEEIGRSLGISAPTVTREWRRARAWLLASMHGEALDG